jgi:DNA-binding transcriptional MerR regulator
LKWTLIDVYSNGGRPDHEFDGCILRQWRLDPALGVSPMMIVRQQENPMSKIAKSLLASEAACHLGVSVKTLRLYEQGGLLRPARTESGYRTYSSDDLLVAQDVLVLRRLGLSLVQIGQALAGNGLALDAVLAQREVELSVQFAKMHSASARLRELRAELAMGHAPKAGQLADALRSHVAGISFQLPWPWGGEQFTLMKLLPLTYLVGPLGSGKTRLALQIAGVLRNAQYVDSLRLTHPGQFERDLELTSKSKAPRISLRSD